MSGAVPGLVHHAGLPLIVPDWPAPPSVHAVATTRLGGVSAGPYASFNLGDHVGDDPAAVTANRRLLTEALALPAPPYWLRQVHGTRVVRAGRREAPLVEADGSWTDETGVVCVVGTADCLPVLFCDLAGTHVAAAHAGWRGLAAGVLEATIAVLDVAPDRLLAWIGPAIGAAAFEVGPEVREVFLDVDASAETAFRRGAGDRWRADLTLLARLRLNRLGVNGVWGGQWCTASGPDRFFSYRRDGVTGRMATLIWRG
jgi:YfiH family protein